MTKVKVEVSNRHVHLSRKEVDVLFGEGYELRKARDLSQPGHFAAHERVHLVNGDKRIENVRVLGPLREKAQVELSNKDADELGLDVPVRLSGNHEGSSGITLEGPLGNVLLNDGVIKAHKHLHVSDKEAEELGLGHGQIVKLRIPHSDTLFDNVIVRVHPEHSMAVHLDYDEAEEAQIDREAFGELIF